MRWWKRREGSCGASCQQSRDCGKRKNSRNEHGLSVFVSFRCLFPRNGRSARIEVSAMTQAQVRDCPSGQIRQRNEEERARTGFDSKSATQNLMHLAAARYRKRNQWPKSALLSKLRLARLAAMQAAILANELPVRQSHWERVQPTPCSIAWSDRGSELPLCLNGSKHARQQPSPDARLRPRRNDLRQKAMPRRRS